MVASDRRTFIGTATAYLAALGWGGCVSRPSCGETLAPWKPGNLDLHFIYTGCGENMFYRLPDGTAVLNDVGEFYRPKDLPLVPLLPSSERLGGDWVSRYIRRVYPEKTIDYAVFSHWHADHIGHADFGSLETPESASRFRTTADGRKVDGFLCVAEEFGIGRVLDHQYPKCGTYGSQDTSMKLLNGWMEAQGDRAPLREPFVVGALDQIRLRRDPAAYRDAFSVRNVCANGVVWDGKGGSVDVIGEHVAATGNGKVSQNLLSCGLLIRYGDFSYLACGDIQRDPVRRRDGTERPFDACVGAAVGPVSVCKMTHHGCSNAMSGEFLRSVRADAYVACMWCPSQCAPKTLDRIRTVTPKGGGRPLIVPQLIAPLQRAWMEANGFGIVPSPAAHVVVRVAPGGGSYCVHLIDAADESGRVLAKFERRS